MANVTTADLIMAATSAKVDERLVAAIISGAQELPAEDLKRVIQLAVNHPSPEVRAAAVVAVFNAVNQYDDSDFDSLGAVLLRDKEPVVRARAATFLASTRLRKAVYGATNDPVPLVRQQAYLALFEKADAYSEEFVTLAQKALKDPSDEVKRVALKRIRFVQEQNPHGVPTALLTSVVPLTYYSKSDIATLAKQVVMDREIHSNEESVTVLTTLRLALGYADPDVFALAVHNRLDSEEVLQATIDCLAYPATHTAAALALAKHRERRYVDLATIRNDLQACRFPWGICNSSVLQSASELVGLLDEAIKSNSQNRKRVALATVHALLYYNKAQDRDIWFPLVHVAAKDDNETVRAMAMTAATYFAKTPLRDKALEIGLLGAKDKSSLVKGAAIWLVGTVPDENEAINNAIFNALTDKNGYVRNIASAALSRRISFR